MSPDFETLHPRGNGGKFATKQHASPDTTLTHPDGNHPTTRGQRWRDHADTPEQRAREAESATYLRGIVDVLDDLEIDDSDTLTIVMRDDEPNRDGTFDVAIGEIVDEYGIQQADLSFRGGVPAGWFDEDGAPHSPWDDCGDVNGTVRAGSVRDRVDQTWRDAGMVETLRAAAANATRDAYRFDAVNIIDDAGLGDNDTVELFHWADEPNPDGTFDVSFSAVHRDGADVDDLAHLDASPSGWYDDDGNPVTAWDDFLIRTEDGSEVMSVGLLRAWASEQPEQPGTA